MKAAIQIAISDHSMWKSRLQELIEHGKIQVPAVMLKLDNQCKFGKWLYGPTITENVKHSERYKKVKSLHTEFHSIVAKVTELTLSGRRIEAEKFLATQFDLASTQLIEEMRGWQRELE